MAAPFWEMSTKVGNAAETKQADGRPGSNVVPAEHRLGRYTIVYDLALPTSEQLADDGGMGAFLAECVEQE